MKTRSSVPLSSLSPASIAPRDLVEWETLDDARATFKDARTTLLNWARGHGFYGRLSLPRATMRKIEQALWVGVLHYDPTRGHRCDQKMNMDNVCIKWARDGMWRFIGAGIDAPTAIAGAALLIDSFPVHMVVSRDGVQVDAGEEFVKLCDGDMDLATEFLELHRDYIVAMLALNVAARGKKANVVSFGDAAERYVKKQLAVTGLVAIMGRFMHPQAMLALSGADIPALLEAGKLYFACTRRGAYVAADGAARATAAICGFDVVVRLHVDVFEGKREILGALAELRSQRSKDCWASLSDEEKAARLQTARDRWTNLSDEEKAARLQGMSDGLDEYWANVSDEGYEAHCQAVSDGLKKYWAALSDEEKEARCQALRHSGDAKRDAWANLTDRARRARYKPHSKARNANISAALSNKSTKRVFCPGGCGFSLVGCTNLFRTHFGLAQLTPSAKKKKRIVPIRKDCLTVVRAAVAAENECGTLGETFMVKGDLATWDRWSK